MKMNRSIVLVGVVLCVFCLTPYSKATTLNVNLDLQYSDPGDVNSGGNWTVSALAGNFGLAGITFKVSPANFTGDFLVSNSVSRCNNPSLLVEASDLRLLTATILQLRL